MVGSPVVKASALILAACLVLSATADTLTCSEAQGRDGCHGLAYCDATNTSDYSPTGFKCQCPDDLFGSGYAQDFIDQFPTYAINDAGCNTEAATVRLSFLIGDFWDDSLSSSGAAWGPRLNRADMVKVRDWIVDEVFGGAEYPYKNTSGFSYRITTDGDCGDNAGIKWFSANLLFKDVTTAAKYLEDNLNDDMKRQAVPRPGVQNASEPFFGMQPDPITNSSKNLRIVLSYSADVGNGVTEVGTLGSAPRVYEWTAGTTEDPITIMPTGMVVESVDFKHDCLTAGCWVVDVTYTRGENNANVFYIPRTNNDDKLSYDYVYGEEDASKFFTYSGKTEWHVDKTFQPSNFPCGNDAYSYAEASSDPIQRTVTACCIPEFIDNYRPLNGFATSKFGDLDYTALKSACAADLDNAPEVSMDNLFCNALSGQFHDADDFSGHWSSATTPNVYAATNMDTSHVDYMGVIDPFLGVYRATFYLDEVEMRRFAGKLEGTVSVEHSVDFFVGLAEFKPSGKNQYIDMATKQTDIHVEKTDYFSVATHGENAYTFLRYVNLRLVQVYDEDTSRTDDAATSNFYRTTPTYTTQYVQVTFTLGSDYEKKPNFDIIPSDSVRIGYGEFSSNAVFAHACEADWTKPTGPGPTELNMNEADKGAFMTALAQGCAPQSKMCLSPPEIPDSFVAFNVPAFDGTAEMGYFGDTTTDLSNNIFIDLVVQVQNTDVMAGGGTTANITKTTLRAQIPVVEGGINLFCDSVGAKTDLKEVADVTIVIGTAASEGEFSRLRVLEDVAESTMQPGDSERVDTDSIESALMTLIVLGDDDFFRTRFGDDGSAAANFGLELEDVITIHVMEDTGDLGPFDAGTTGGNILALVDAAGEELYDSNNVLQTDGYALNGAFRFVIDRVNNVAQLETTQALAGIGCAFSAQQGTTVGDQAFPTTCIVRRDVRGRNCMRKANGADSVTASELPHCADAACATVIPPSTASTGTGCNPHLTPADYMKTVLGDNAFAAELGTNFAAIIAKKYELNNRSRRAWFINPGYEWTGVQTGGQSKFQVSQKLFMFALFGLNENRRSDSAGVRRRFLFQATDGAGDGSSAMSTTAMSTGASFMSTLATANGVESKDVAMFAAEVALTQEEACMSDAELKNTLRASMAGAVEMDGVAESVLEVQIPGTVTRELNGVVCSRRAGVPRKLLADYSDATAKFDMYVVFEKIEDAPKRFISMAKMEDALTDRLSASGTLTAKNAVAEDSNCISNCGEQGTGDDTNTGNGNGNGNGGGNTFDISDSDSGFSPLSAPFSTLLACAVAVFAFGRKY